jgi:hypothetical protein
VSLPILARSDVYFKRSHFQPALDQLEPSLARRVVPLGFACPCASLGAKLRVGRAAISRAFLRDGGFRALRPFLSLPPPGALRQSPDAPVTATIVYQTRVWNDAEAPPGAAEPLNESRVALIDALQEAFGDQFVGGLMPTSLALKRYPRYVTRQPFRRRSYLSARKRHLIGICTLGLQESTPFKWPECLAASQCAVAVPLRHALPTPVEPGRHYLPFTTPAECIDACRRLLADRDAADTMRRENAAYFAQEVEPAALVARLLTCAVSRSG